jgi:hypothetical protein
VSSRGQFVVSPDTGLSCSCPDLKQETHWVGTTATLRKTLKMPTRKIYDPSIVWPAILDNIANGDSLPAALAKLDPAPSHSWAKLSLRSNEALREAYQQAAEDRADRLADELIELADSRMPADLDGSAMSAWVQQLRLRIDARKWAASKLRPRVYGDRLDVSVSPGQISVSQALEAANQRASTVIDRQPDGSRACAHTGLAIRQG